MFLDSVKKPIQKFFMFVSALTLVEPLADMPISGVKYSHIFVRLPSLGNCCEDLIHTIIADTKICFQANLIVAKNQGA